MSSKFILYYCLHYILRRILDIISRKCWYSMQINLWWAIPKICVYLTEMRGYISADRYFADIRSFLRISDFKIHTDTDRFDGRQFFAKLIYLAHLTTWIVFTHFCIRMYTTRDTCLHLGLLIYYSGLLK